MADVEYIMLGMPGDSLSDAALNTAGLPSVPAMLRGCQRASRLFKQPAKGEHEVYMVLGPLSDHGLYLDPHCLAECIIAARISLESWDVACKLVVVILM